jgi:predicted kinase
VRSQPIGLAAAYGARISLVALEAPPGVLAARNRARSSPVPDVAAERMARRWEAPDLTEAHSVAWVDTR